MATVEETPPHVHTAVPLCYCAPGSMFIGEDVEDLLFQLIGCHMIAVFGGTDEVITHRLFFFPVCRVLCAVRLTEIWMKEREREKRCKRLTSTVIITMNQYTDDKNDSTA